VLEVADSVLGLNSYLKIGIKWQLLNLLSDIVLIGKFFTLKNK